MDASPCLWFTRLPLRELVDLLHRRHFPRLDRRVAVRFGVQERLVTDARREPCAALHRFAGS